MRSETSQTWKDKSPRATGPALDAEATAHLSRRLEQLHDEQWIKQALEGALGEMAGRSVEVSGIQIEYCKVKPGRDINLALKLRLRTHPFGEPVQRRMSCTLWSDVGVGRSHFASETAALAPNFADASRELPGFNRLINFVPELAMLVRLFPVDAGLVGLLPATNITDMLPLLDSHLSACREGWHARDLQIEVVLYKPGRRCTLRYLVGLSRPYSQETRSQEVFGKVYRDDRWRSCFDVQLACSEAADRSGGAWRAAKPIMAVPAWRLSVQEAVSGRPFRDVFGELTHDDATEDDLARAEVLLRAIARAIGSLQRGTLHIEAQCDFRSLVASQERNLAYLQQSEPALAEELTRLTRELGRAEPTIPALPLRPAHCDLALANVLVDGDRIGFIDFDRAARAEPAYDVAYFLTHLWSFGIRHPRREQHVQRLCDTFRTAYLDLAPDVSPERLALYEALDLVAYVLRSFRKQSYQSNWRRWALAQTDAASRRLAFATGQGRVM